MEGWTANYNYYIACTTCYVIVVIVTHIQMRVVHIRAKNIYVYGFLSRYCLVVKYYNIPIIYELTCTWHSIVLHVHVYTCTRTYTLYISISLAVVLVGRRKFDKLQTFTLRNCHYKPHLLISFTKYTLP